MCGSALVITSPSISSTKRSTPWALGCCGPKLRVNGCSPSVRVVIRHGAKQSVKLTVNGEAVDPLSFEATNVSPDKRFAVSIWRGIRLKNNLTHLVATVRNPDGSIAEELRRDVKFADTPMHGTVVKEQTHLVADGVSRPVLAVRLTDRYGNPVHAGVSGTFTVNSPYQSASAVEAQQSRALTGFGAASASWLVEGDDGIAHIELAPTMVSGALHLQFEFSDGDTHREEALESWVQPGDQPWTLIGLAEGAIGSESVAKNMERDGDFDSDLGKNARVAFYAKGRVLGRYLLTVAYDSAKQKADQQLLGIIDPNAYYTVFADNTQRLYDAASHEKLYVRVESAAFYALFGDFDTGFDQTTLAAYQRTLTGAKGEAQLYPRFTPTSEWDTAAGQAVLESAGGSVVCLDGSPLRYGKGGDNLNPFFIAAATPELAQRGAAEMRRLLAAK